MFNFYSIIMIISNYYNYDYISIEILFLFMIINSKINRKKKKYY